MQLTDRDKARQSGAAVFLHLFDILHLDWHELTGLTLRLGRAGFELSSRF